ncbi:penicillin-binding protein 2 [Streptomyces sp. SAJ15]|uniref:peptidoglycan D,D-transpeptidase FtsI family protein n=1 Tax=Streptomyces sp. SAJ15 TaxID=2011095 RepID=UPI001186DD15|nr:penicillin-binding transpeptidase domain-containing protein [Streptomyces sp. SAJ15]TVL88114.1 penicillin-binding protein [Streptomyces sp. SAJ15]
MNRPIRHIAIFSGLLILALLLQANNLGFKRAEELQTHEENDRVKIEAFAHPRGNIIVGGNPITGSVAVENSDFKYKRVFKNGPMYAPVTGYSSQTYGYTHLEALNNKLLSGTDDRLFLQNTVDMFTGKKRQGGDVVTTINPEAQKAAYKGLGDKVGAVVAIEPSTGKILALASTPSYDPSVFAGSSNKDAEAWNKLQKDKRKPMVNRALKETYAPGSTFKVITAAAALEHGKYSDVNAPTDSPDPWTMPDTNRVLPNHSPTAPCKNASLNVAMQHSCNNVYGKVSADLGKDKMRETAEKFGFNNPKVDTPTRAVESVFPKEMDRPQTAMSGIGQSSVRATPLQIVMMTAAIANDGTLMKPYMVEQVRGADLDPIEEHEPEVMSEAVSEDTAKKIQEMMEDTAEKGTGKPGRIAGVTVGAKTGTAQRGIDNEIPPLAWFISYAKQGDGSPVAVAVMIDPENSIPRDQISGGGLAGPIAKKVMEAVLKSKK